ncbi:hypothetical protein FACS189462_4810 [Spirochaetia bacterium]|nr:hypothetical protein FACS189462_4810 [Spirochaetia bacterium]
MKMKKKYVPMLFIVLLMVISASCTGKKSAINSQGEIMPENTTPYEKDIEPDSISNIEAVYVFDIDSFTYFDEFPETISGAFHFYY